MILLICLVVFAISVSSILLHKNSRLKVRAEEEARQWRQKRDLEARIIQSEERYRTIVETAHDMVWTLDARGNFTYINQRSEEITGHNISDLKGKSFVPLIYPDDLQKVQEVFLQTLQGTPQSYEVRVYDSRGKIIILAVNTVPLYEGDIVMGTVSFGRDITENRRVEDALKESEAKYRNMIETSSDIIWMLDKEGKFIFINKRAEEISGYSINDWLDKGFVPLLPPADLKRTTSIFHEVLKGNPMHYEANVIRKDGSIFCLSVNTAPLYSEKKVVGTISFGQDITDRKRTEKLALAQRDIAIAASETYSLAEILNLCLASAINISAMDAGGIYIVEKPSHGLRLMVHKGLSAEFADGLSFYAADSPNTQLVMEGEPIYALDAKLSLINSDVKSHEGLKTIVVIPILFENDVIGCINLASRRDKELLQDEKIALETLARQIGALIVRKESENILRQQTEDIALLLEASQIFSSTQDLDSVLMELNRRCGDVLGVDISFVRLIEGDRLTIKSSFYRFEKDRKEIEHLLEQNPIHLGEGIAGRVALTGESLDSNDRESLSLTLPGFVGFLNRRSWLVVPMKVKDRLTGVLTLISSEKKRKFIERDISIAQAIANQVAIVIENANLFMTMQNELGERKRAEETLRQSEERLSTFINSATDAFTIWDAELNLVDLNQAALSYVPHGVEKKDLIGKNIQVLESDVKGSGRLKQFLAVVKTGKPFISEAMVLHLKFDNVVSDRFLNVRAFKVGNGLGIMTTDITEGKRAEVELRQSERQYRTFFENDLTGDYISSLDGRLLSCNPAFVSIFGFKSIEEALQTNVKALFPLPKQRQELLDKIRVQKKLEYYEMEMLRRDGKIVSIIANIYGKFDSSGNLTETLGYLFDDTKHRELEKQLVQAQKLESLGTLAGGIAHDFNNILSIIIGHTSLLEKVRSKPEKFAQGVAAINKASQRATALVKQLLTFARKTEVVFRSVRVNEMIEEITKILSETFPKTITISTSLYPDMPSITADANQLHQVLLNLCVNARDAMPTGGRLFISTRVVENLELVTKFPKASARQYVEIVVSDTGIGMDEAIWSKIFEPFFTTKGPGRGTGLGLTVIYGIVENHHGFIDVKSEVGHGTAFRVMLPVPERFVERSESQHELAKEVPGGTETVLLVEDEDGIRELTHDFLVVKGYKVLMAADGKEAIDTYLSNQKEIAVVISDIGLPKFSGIELLKKLKVINPTVKVIFASGYIDPHTRSEILEAGAKYFIQKPYQVNEVLTMVREAIDS